METPPLEHQHEWRTVYEESFVGPPFAIAYECRLCSKWIEKSNVDPISGIGGKRVNEQILVGINGGPGNCKDGTVYKRQIIHEDGRLEVLRP